MRLRFGAVIAGFLSLVIIGQLSPQVDGVERRLQVRLCQ